MNNINERKTNISSPNSSSDAKSYSNIKGSNERMKVGIIGCGNFSKIHIKELLELKNSENVDIVSVSDVYEKRMKEAEAATGAEGIKDYRKILDNKDIDYVLISTPEHWHYQMSIDALDAGKHIYVEKPMAHTIQQAKLLVQKVEKTGLKMQVGIQGMSDDSYETAQQMINNGALGKVVMAHIDFSRNHIDDFWAYQIDKDAKPGVNLDWEAWLGPSPKREWDPQRYFQWRRYWDYSSGIASDLFIHRITRIIKSLNLKFPDYVSAAGGTWNFTDSNAEVPDTFNMLVDYPEKVTMVVVSSLANDLHTRHLIRGHKATLEFTSEGFLIYPQDITKKIYKSDTYNGPQIDQEIFKHQKTGAENIGLHHKNLIHAIRYGEKINCDHRLGYYGLVACTMGVESFRRRKYMQWDSKTERAFER